ncbi:hypothetical protein [Streptomyces sp. M54]|uniref:hypothetical protein n=1 Tax=Streptomyces sp. M54 TaxID=2759525 RepID=UPI001A8C50CE|nr:hypothetical protein [Streptomyces sp. M54]QSS92884.1 hypothetical protein H3V39_22620 [Streptomyces sp. M54]
MRIRMSSLLFVALCSLAPAVIGSLQNWSPWLWGFLSAVTASGSLLIVMTVSRGERPPAEQQELEEPEPPAEEPYQETRVVDAALPSATDGYDFLFSATVWWRPAPDSVVPGDAVSPALAESSVLSRALEVVRHEEPRRSSFARYLLEGELCVPLRDRSGRVEAMAADVTLTLAPADRDRLRKLSDLRKDEEVWEHEREHERNKRRYLGDDVLKSPGSAVVWWLARHEDEIEKAVDMIGPLAQVSAAANDAEVPELFRHLLVPPVGARARAEAEGGAENPLWVGDGQGAGMFDREEEVGVADRLLLLLEATGLKPDMDEYTVIVHRIVMSLEGAGLYEAADEIRRDVMPRQGTADAAGPEDGMTGAEGFRPGPRSEDLPYADEAPSADGEPEGEPYGGTTAPGAAGSTPGEHDGYWWRPDENVPPATPHTEDTAASPYYWDSSHSRHRPTTPREQDAGDES